MRKPPLQVPDPRPDLTDHLDVGTTSFDDPLTDPKTMKLPDDGSGGYLWISNIVILKSVTYFFLFFYTKFFFQIIIKQSL